MRIAVLSLHTSPAAQPGQGDAGGMNVYVQATAKELVRAGHEVEIFTADPLAPTADTVELEPGIRLHQLHSAAGDKTELADVVPELAAAIRSHSAFAGCALVWAHYWISAEVGLRLTSASGAGETAAAGESSAAGGGKAAGEGGAAKETTAAKETAAAKETTVEASMALVPLAVSFHTIAAVKDRDTGRANEPAQRLAAERHIAARAQLLIANTTNEADDMQYLLGASPAQIVLAPPGVDRDIYTPGPMQTARRGVGEESADLLLLYVGRMQHVKGTDTAIEALAALRRLDPVLAGRVRLIMLGAASGEDTDGAEFAARIGSAGLSAQVEVLPPVPAETLAEWYRAADIVIVPSRSESFGFAAAEAAAAGVPVIASAVGGLEYVVAAGTTGLLVADDDPLTWAMALEALLIDPALRARMGHSAHRRAQEFDWQQCVAAVVAAAERRDP